MATTVAFYEPKAPPKFSNFYTHALHAIAYLCFVIWHYSGPGLMSSLSEYPRI